ncbi:TPA: hypothetical protein ACH3X1_000613 [Trebouxia sp. C0004]
MQFCQGSSQWHADTMLVIQLVCLPPAMPVSGVANAPLQSKLEHSCAQPSRAAELFISLSLKASLLGHPAVVSIMLWLQSWDNYSHPAGLSSCWHAYTWSSKAACPEENVFQLPWPEVKKVVLLLMPLLRGQLPKPAVI